MLVCSLLSYRYHAELMRIWREVFLGALDGKFCSPPRALYRSKLLLLNYRHYSRHSTLSNRLVLQQITSSVLPRDVVPLIRLLLHTALWETMWHPRRVLAHYVSFALSEQALS